MRNMVLGTVLATLLVGCGSEAAPPSSAPDATSPDAIPSGADASGVSPDTSSQPERGPSTVDALPPTADSSHDAKPTAAPTFAWSPTSLAFDSTTLGESTAPRTASLTNTSDVDAAELGLHLNGSQFALGQSACSGALKAHASCTVAITYRPTLAVPAEGIVSVMLGQVELEISLHLSGTGLAPDSGTSTPDAMPGVYPMCASPLGPDVQICEVDNLLRLHKDGFLCARCLDGMGSTQECHPAESPDFLCVKSCGECN